MKHKLIYSIPRILYLCPCSRLSPLILPQAAKPSSLSAILGKQQILQVVQGER